MGQQKDYQEPSLQSYGSVESITKEQFNKEGLSSDQYTDDTNGAIIGSLEPV